MPLTITIDQRVQIRLPNQAVIDDKVKPSRLIFDISPVSPKKALLSLQYNQGPRIENEYFELDDIGIMLSAHRVTTLENGNVRMREVPDYLMMMQISEQDVMEAEEQI